MENRTGFGGFDSFALAKLILFFVPNIVAVGIGEQRNNARSIVAEEDHRSRARKEAGSYIKHSRSKSGGFFNHVQELLLTDSYRIS